MSAELIKILQDAKAQWGLGTVEAIKKKIADDRIIYQSNLLNSIGFSQDDTPDGNITFKMTDYGKFVDEGVNGLLVDHNSEYSFRGNWQGTAFAIKAWADSKGLNNFALGHSIQKKGIKPRRFFNSVVEARIPDLASDLEEAYIGYLEGLINRQQKP